MRTCVWGMLTVKADMLLLPVTLCDPYLSTLEAFAKTRYTNRRYLYLCFYRNGKISALHRFSHV